MTDRKRNFIVIDDNKLDCFIEQKIILNTGVSGKIHLFLDAGEALELIKSGMAVDNDEKIIIIVDIQMPLMNGFEFVEAFETLPNEIQDKYQILMLSSSINENDLNRVRNYKSVIQFISKPLSIKKLVAFIE
ncbi:MAG: response regulator [Chitinophagaceae bacterium]